MIGGLRVRPSARRPPRPSAAALYGQGALNTGLGVSLETRGLDGPGGPASPQSPTREAGRQEVM